ncbi:phage protein [Paenibacillus sp. VT-400]|nr:phage protein [Paenibacillus sp. VT-400]
MFNEHSGISPVGQDFVWVGEYIDGTYLSEFDLTTKEENSFYDIDRDRLVRFGVIGHGNKFFFENDGVFNLGGSGIEVIYKDGEREYNLTGHAGKFHDIITYKDAESSVNFAVGQGGTVADTTITQFNFGYKSLIEIDGVTFQFKATCRIPFGEPMYINFWLVADQQLNGVLLIKKNNRIATELKAPLRKGVGGEVNFGLS